jgi:site-specific DNA-methyltransferase (adenine-specific)
MQKLLNTVYGGNNLDLLKKIADNTIDSIVTDPPYSFDPATSKTWDGADPRRDERDKHSFQQRIANGVNYKLSSEGMQRFQDWTKEWATEVYRVLKPGAHGFVFAASKTQHHVTCGLERAGFEVREVLVWGYATGTPKGNRDISADLKKLVPAGTEVQEGLGTILKPAYEPIILIRKPIAEATVAENVLKWGVGGINIDVARTPYEKPPAKRKLSKKDQETIVNKDKAIEAHPLGRWPATIVLTDDILPDDWSKFFMVPKPSMAEKTHGGRVENEHSTIKPIHLMKQLILMVTPKNGVVIDPFSGSGTTLVAAKELGINFIGAELEEKSVKTASARLAVTNGPS